MTNALTQYKKELTKHLRCCGRTKTRLLVRFDRTLSPFLEECDVPSMETLYTAFGPPDGMAALLMSEITSEEAAHYRRMTWAKRITAGILAALLFAFTIYVYFEKQSPLEVNNQIIVEAFWEEPDDTGVSPNDTAP